jgi:transcriptional regulator with GAF, ATPase, and Fis domain
LPLTVQGKLLRAIEEKSIDRIGGKAPIAVDVRIVAATNKDLRTAADKGEFRSDLFFRLAFFPIDIPPLRERGDDSSCSPGTSRLNWGKSCVAGSNVKRIKRTGTALTPWPGNVRELKNTIERACILADSAELQPKDLGLHADTHREATAFGFDLSGTLNEAAERAVRMVERRGDCGRSGPM